jgi:hypothetical protein
MRKCPFEQTLLAAPLLIEGYGVPVQLEELRRRQALEPNQTTTANTKSTINLFTHPSIGFVKESTCCQRLPNSHPADVRARFHTKLPAVVQNRKGPKGINSIPAGTEIKVRIAGINRPQKTTAVPWR